jgi:hypothetical protein
MFLKSGPLPLSVGYDIPPVREVRDFVGFGGFIENCLQRLRVICFTVAFDWVGRNVSHIYYLINCEICIGRRFDCEI